MPKKKRLLWQLYPSYLLITVISVMGVTWYASSSLRQFFLGQTASDLEARARLVEKQIEECLDPPDEKCVDLLCKRIGRRASTRITIILPSGKVIGDSREDPAKMDNHVDRPEFMQALTGPSGTSMRYSRTLEKNMMYVGIPVKANEQTLAVVRTSIPVTAIDVALKEIQIRIAGAGLVIALFAAALSLIVSRRITRPIEELRKGAESFARGDFQCTLPVSESEEIGGLAEAMNEMARQLHERINTIIGQRNEIEGVLCSMIEGVIAVDMDERVLSMNNAAARMFGCNASEAQGRSIQEIVRNTVLREFVTDTLSSEKPVERDVVLSSNGDLFLSGHGTLLQDAQGKQIGALIVLNDVTRLRRLEEIRRDFVANVSHEIKTPITAIKGFVETLREGAVKNPDDAERFLGIIEKHVERLEAIIEDLLSLSRIERGTEREENELVENSVKDVLDTAIQVCEVGAAARKIDIELSCPENLFAKMEPRLLEQAVVNLLDNAVKYSNKESSIRVEASQGEGEIILSVRDEGCGIEKKHLSRLFERFYRVDKARSRQLGGTGLGLAIVKHIAQAHGGHVNVESTPGKGSTFSIYLPGR
ncbi:MAG: cell wall metabolism sensor histidine kinase WalK [Deltaproteobacteria bacterium]|jgi:two-component system phosphate regulon sensor histidine kinase PhoR|nr:cell wall metabolism sensor histidine kinase WalK [Deltaproteobacteria bacterium]